MCFPPKGLLTLTAIFLKSKNINKTLPIIYNFLLEYVYIQLHHKNNEKNIFTRDIAINPKSESISRSIW